VSDTGLAYFKDCTSLMFLGLSVTKVSDAGLAHFKDCKELTRLVIARTKITDLSLLKEMPLKELDCDFRPERDAEILRSIKTLEQINRKPAAEFWKEFDEQAARTWDRSRACRSPTCIFSQLPSPGPGAAQRDAAYPSVA
ncbi:MAG: hypothetical protein L0Y71_17805, partial [Gemmataceae bacterium]|nr:hypothetical protein [Gemmataceae bacterium]